MEDLIPTAPRLYSMYQPGPPVHHHCLTWIYNGGNDIEWWGDTPVHFFPSLLIYHFLLFSKSNEVGEVGKKGICFYTTEQGCMGQLTFGNLHLI